jgi:hypothetical protein
MDSFVFNNKLTIRMTEDCYKSFSTYSFGKNVVIKIVPKTEESK